MMNGNSAKIQDLYNEAVRKHQSGDFNNAYQLYRLILQTDPKHSDTLFMLGNLFYQNNNMNEALAHYQSAIEIKHEDERYINALGKVYLAMNLLNKAEECFNKSLNIKPDYINPYLNLGRLNKNQNNFDEAEKYYRKSLELDPSSIIANNNLGNILREKGKLNEAVACYETVLKINPNQPEAHVNLGNVLSLSGEKEKALVYYKNALMLNPNYIDAEYQTIIIRMDQCDWSSREKDINRIIQLIEIYTKNKSFHSLIPLMNPGYYPIPPADNLKAAKLNAHLIRDRVKDLKAKVNFSFNRTESRKLRVAYMSPDFREHAVGILIYDLFRYHDRDKFEIFAYSNDPLHRKDFYTNKIEDGVDHFIDLAGMDIESAAKKINDDKIDILVDLAGYTANAGIEILALQPAPVQACYLGFSNTTGSDFIQYMIADPFVITDQLSEYYTEKIVYLPQRFISSPLKVSEKEMTRAEFGIPDDKFVFCCFNNITKLEPDVFKSWMNILHQTPESVLWLTKPDKTIHANLLNEIDENGISKERVIFAPKQPLDEFLARNRLADLFLDTFHYSAGTTAVCSLISGLPLITLPGKSFASRLSGSILQSSGLSELICKNVAEYEEKAIYYYQNRRELNAINEKILSCKNSLPLFDLDTHALNLERAYKKMWDIFKRGERPKSFET